MKITVIGDIHGRDVWRQIVKRNRGSHFVFSGDYLDPYQREHIQEDDAIENFQELIDFKNSNPSNVTFLIGNHDAQYLFYPYFGTQGKSKLFLQEIIDIFRLNRNLFDFAFQKNNYIFTHAGISNAWFKENRPYLERFDLKPDLSNLAITLNKVGEDPKGIFLFDSVSHHRGGFDKYGSPIWADKRELLQGLSLTGFHQVIGHTKVYDIETYGDIDTSITFCDCLFNKINELTLNI